MPLRIGMVASEVAPFAKTGGLGDVTAALAKHLHRRGHDVRLFLPLYGNLKPSGQSFVPVEFLREVPLRLGPHAYTYTVLTARLPGTDLPVYFVRNPVLYGRAATYSGEGDEHRRFAFLSKVALESFQRMGFAPYVVHAHDWHTALMPLLVKTDYSWDRLFARTRSVLTLHNLGYQGSFAASALHDLGLAHLAGRFHPGQLSEGRISFLVTGLLWADALTTVSETHAREMTTPDGGWGLDGMLRARSGSLVGIVNGIDAEEWDPSRDPLIPATYHAGDLSGKAACKAALLREAGLPHDPSAPVIGMVSRLTVQKGIDLVMEVLPRVLAERDVRLVVLGTGERRYEAFFEEMARRFPGKARYRTGYSNELAHRIEAGADLFLMPSMYEPCGLNQMYSQRYGTVPVVRATGGLADTVSLWNPATGEGTGFVFEHYTTAGLAWALEYALATWKDRAAWRRLVANGMSRDFSWDRQIGRYVALYEALLAR